ncbi:autotransporter assembly complex protein TamA [Moraxella macacae]|nr:BamA/TamA family outer membrane protein [Moraxella macacae]
MPKNPFYRTSLSLAILSVSGLISPVLADTTSNLSQNPTAVKPKAIKEDKKPTHNQQMHNQQIFAAENYVYQVDNDVNNDNANKDNQQNFTNKIDQHLENQTLINYDNFDQPIAAFETKPLLNKPLLNKHGLNKPGLNNDDTQTDLPTLEKPPQTIINTANLNTGNLPKPVSNAELNINNQLDLNGDTKQKNQAQQNQANQTDELNATDILNPDDYLPEYQQKTAQLTTETPKSKLVADKPSLFSKLKNKVLNTVDGINYIDVKIVNADEKQQPAKNIKAALEQVTVESVEDFNASLGRLHQVVTAASEAVGYYDVKASFKHVGGDDIEVSLEIGKPVTVQHRLLDIRGDGADGEQALPVYHTIEQEGLPRIGDVFDHGVYEGTKAMVEGVSQTNGFFDGHWLNSSVDVVLPDNVADVDLVYDTKQRYQFGDIKVYSIDKQGNLSDDPDKLPIKPKLLQQLIPYQKGDLYYQPLVTKLNNNLAVSRYFNGLNVDVILPGKDNAGVNFQNQNQDTQNQNNNSQDKPDKADDKTDNQAKDNQAKKTTQNPEDYAPLTFNIEDSIQKRLDVIQTKSNILLQAPEDIELAPDETNKSKNPLVIVANAVSGIVKKIDRDNHNDANQIKIWQALSGGSIQKLSPTKVAQQKSIPTYIILDATKPHEAQIGLGYETDAGVRAVGKINNNLVNRHGYQAGISVALSKVEQAIEFTGSLPYKHPLHDKLTGSLGYQHKNSDDLANTFKVDSLYANVARNIHKDTGWNRTLSLRYRGDKLALQAGNYKTDSLPYPFNNYASDFTQEALLLGYALHKTTADDLVNPTQGYSQRYSIEAGSDRLLTDTNLAILRAGGTWLHSFGNDKKHQVLGRLDLGYIYSDNFYDVPYRLRFFAGGDQSIRGFNTDTLSPTYGDQSFLVGGNALAIGSLEYNYAFKDGLRLAMFGDVGNAFDTTGETKNRTEVGLGLGVRWSSPIGPVRLDVATGVTGKDKPVRIHFFIGSPL